MNPFHLGMRVQFRNVHVRRDHPELHAGTVTDIRHHSVTVEWDGRKPVHGSYHYSSLIEIDTPEPAA